jgi:hypothetical protein
VVRISPVPDSVERKLKTSTGVSLAVVAPGRQKNGEIQSARHGVHFNVVLVFESFCVQQQLNKLQIADALIEKRNHMAV